MDEVQKKIDLYAEYLNAIARTRLLFNPTSTPNSNGTSILTTTAILMYNLMN